MKTKLNKIYHRYFSEIMTGILASLLIITGLLIFGIWNSTNQRENIRQTTQGKLDIIRNEQSEMRTDLMVKSDSIEISLREKLDNINKK
ncbi:hypothetical protein [Epilithonimonas xixisoli]|uniref:Uncharacterized protein n=1 Tax=Epilithonimonas xixisoli TaxID=1476462 RepID=A0A4R8I530_9FLAO|nr:hypothetical protein [Epilithonimonas xixisoli]TDX83997.1 hypothetical protein B0I22_1585 [Epilithonimonas xixisoli]